jgi:hypothetical protein
MMFLEEYYDTPSVPLKRAYIFKKIVKAGCRVWFSLFLPKLHLLIVDLNHRVSSSNQSSALAMHGVWVDFIRKPGEDHLRYCVVLGLACLLAGK